MSDEVRGLKSTLHGSLAGYLTGFKNGQNVRDFVNEFRCDEHCTVFSLITHTTFLYSDKFMSVVRA